MSGRPLAHLRLAERFAVLIADGQDITRLGLRALLSEHRGLEVIGDVATVAAAVAAVRERQPDLVVVTAWLGDVTGFDACRRILACAPDTRVVILGERGGEAATQAALRAGALGWLSRHADPAAICRTLRDAAAGARLLAVARPPARDVLALTPQERRVLGLVARGKTNKEIGAALGLSEKTVKNYLSHAFEKLSVSRRAQAAVLFARRYGARPGAAVEDLLVRGAAV
jgi:two-component system response regulator DevR